MTVGQRIAAKMAELKMSQNRLARLAQISQSGLSSIINGQSSPKENTLKAIAAALNCSASELLGEDEPQEESWALRERLRRDPDYRLLFDAADRATPEHLRAAAAMLKALEGTNKDD